MKPEINLAECSVTLTEPHTWILHIMEAVLAILAIITNCILTVVVHSAVPIPYPERRILASISFNFVLLAVYQFARNLFHSVSIYQRCVIMVTTSACKLYEFPLLFCYIHGAVTICIVALLTTTHIKANNRSFQRTSTCSVWQSVVMVACIAGTLVFIALDHDVQPANVSQIAAQRTAWNRLLLKSAFFVGSTPALHTARVNAASYIIVSLKEVIAVETVMWHCSLFFSGCFILYQHVITDSCDECIVAALEMSFMMLPLIIAFLHPMLIIWFVFPMRDAAARACPCLRSVLAE